MTDSNFLTVKGDQIVNGRGERVVLRGFGLGGWMNMENFITGYAGNEEAQRDAVRSVLGQEKYEFFYDRLLTYFFEEDDARYIQSLGLNLLRLPVNYRHFEDDMRPFEIKEEGFKHLDRAIELCSRYGIYTIIDLHAVQGYQQQDWHSDNPTHKALFWQHKHFQDRAVHLWEVFAERYKGNPWIAGYNPINEPYDVGEAMIDGVYRRMVSAIRAIDPDHVLFLEGNRYSKDFHMFPETLPNSVYTNHLYAAPGFIEGGPYPGETNGEHWDQETIVEEYFNNSEFMIKHHVPVWVGEFGPVYTGDPQKDAMRYHLLNDQLKVYNHYQANWAIWLYKDIGLQGVVYTHPNSAYMQRIRPFLEKKTRLGADAWGGPEDGVRHIMEPVEELLKTEFPHYNPGPFGAMWMARRLIRHILIAEALVPEYAELFRGMSETEIDEMLQSFQFKNCVVREPLAKALKIKS
jgi:endoglucanase